MKKGNNDKSIKLIDILKLINKALQDPDQFTIQEKEKLTIDAASIYVQHNNSQVHLDKDDYQSILRLIQEYSNIKHNEIE